MALWRSAVRSRLGPPDEPPPRAVARGFFFGSAASGQAPKRRPAALSRSAKGLAKRGTSTGSLAEREVQQILGIGCYIGGMSQMPEHPEPLAEPSGVAKAQSARTKTNGTGE